MTTKELRNELGTTLPTDETLDMFLIEHFPNVFKSLSRGMSRTEKETLLLATIDLELLQEQLREFRNSPNYIRMPLLNVHMGGKRGTKPSRGRWSSLGKRIKQLIYADAFLNIVASTLDWVAEKIGVRRKEVDQFRYFRPLFIVILLILIFVTIVRRC